MITPEGNHGMATESGVIGKNENLEGGGGREKDGKKRGRVSPGINGLSVSESTGSPGI